MSFISSKIRFLSLIVVLFCASCVSTGPVTTETDTSKNPVVERPSEFQSSVEVLDKFSDILNQPLHDDKTIRPLAREFFNTLLDHQASILAGNLKSHQGSPSEKQALSLSIRWMHFIFIKLQKRP